MGIIQRQSIKNSIIGLMGVVLGGISVLFIYPLDDEIYGLAQFIYSTAFLLIPFSTFGILSLVVKFYPKFKNPKKKDHGFLTLLSLSLIGAFAIFFLLLYFLKDTFYSILASIGLNEQLIESHESIIFIITVLLAFIMLFQNHAQNYKRIVIPQIINGFLFKIALPVFVLLYFFEYLNLQEFTYSLVGFFAFVLLAMIFYTWQQKQLIFSWDKSFLKKGLKRSMREYAFFGGLNSLGTIMAFRIDSIMVATMLSLSANGVYNKVLFIAAIIDIPTRAISQISAPIISEHCENGNLQEIDKIYKQSSLNLFIAGVLIFLMIWFSIEDIFGIAVNPDSFENGKWIFLFLAVGKLFDMLLSVNTQIVIYSKLFKYNILFVIILGISNLFFNYYLIGEFSVVGAAIATCISLFLYNLIKFEFIWKKLGIQPLTMPTFKILLTGTIIFVGMYFFPDLGNGFLNMIVKSMIIFGVYSFVVWKLKVSEEINDLIRKGLKFIRKS